MRQSLMLLASTALAFTSPLAAEEAAHRQLGAHVHGQGTLNIAIEGGRIDMEFEAPGADIVGFEHAAESADQKTAVDKAKVTLSDALALFKMPKDAGCRLDKADVDVRKEEHHHDGDEHDDDHEHDAAAPEADAKAKAGGHDDDHDEHGAHSEFHAKYSMTCQSPAHLTGLETTYFKAFAGAQALNVSVVAAKGQSQMQLTREKPTLALGGLM